MLPVSRTRTRRLALPGTSEHIRGSWFRAPRRERLEPIPRELRDAYKGKVCVIMMTGPSLKDYDLTDPFFTENVTIGGNKVGELFIPTYYVVTDPVAIKLYKEQMKKAGKAGSEFLVGEFAMPAWVDATSGVFKTHPIQYDHMDRIGRPGERIYHGCTVGCLSIYIAWLMGFRYIFLLGIDGYGVVGEKHATGKQPVGKVSHDRTVEINLGLINREARKQGRFLWTLSPRSVYKNVNRFPVPGLKPRTP